MIGEVAAGPLDTGGRKIGRANGATGTTGAGHIALPPDSGPACGTPSFAKIRVCWGAMETEFGFIGRTGGLRIASVRKGWLLIG